jgi:hypothetical protein
MIRHWDGGVLYYKIYYNYDVLVVPAKKDRFKQQYGNVQRVISQMRSGVPVLLEVDGEVLTDFMIKCDYQYSFVRTIIDNNNTGDAIQQQQGRRRQQQQQLWWQRRSLEGAVEMMKGSTVRKACQQRGLQIAQDYSPNVIGKKFLTAVGYEGGFDC